MNGFDMAFDIYSGGFARFYAREWENVVQAEARKTGKEYRMIYAGDDPGPVDWKEVEEAVERWRAAIVEGLGDNAPEDLFWSESRTTPYFTDRPGWNGYSALVVMAACTACGEPLPEKLDEDALASDVVLRTYDPMLSDSFRSITQVQIWLPGGFDFSFDFVNLCNEKAHIGSVNRLNTDLAGLKIRQDISDAAISSIMRDGYSDSASVRTIATFGLAVFSHIAEKARENHLPILLSF